VKQVDGVSCVSSALKDLVTQHYRRKKSTIVLENAVSNCIFYPREKHECRLELGLPVDAKIIGTAGALDRSRGIRALFEGFAKLAAEDKDIHLAIAGPRRRQAEIPVGSRVHDFGVLAAERVATLLGALDVAVVCNRDSAFGRFCFPQKAYEILACRVPVVAASLGAMSELLGATVECLFEPENSDDLVRAVRAQLKHPIISDLEVPTWDDMGQRLEAFLDALVLETKFSARR
jgi:teichuronic acid biosynthesis glycosyltransferase TuaC